MLDLVLRGGMVVDGSGAPARRGDVAVKDGRIVGVGLTPETATRVIDVDGLVVAPGFVDIHTHFDAQLSWDGTASPAPLHGTTTVVAGNCGFTIAPMEASEAPFLLQMLARVEGIPAEALEQGLDWKWRTFGEWLDRFEGHIGPNAAFLVGHSTLRRLAMGARGSTEPASPEEIAEMERLLSQALAAGAIGFSSSRSPTHFDGDGRPVPSRLASDEELLRLAAAVGKHPGTQLQYIATAGRLGDEHIEFMSELSRVANRPLNWNTLRVESADQDFIKHQLRSFDFAAANGGSVFALLYPDVTRRRLFMSTGIGLTHMPEWGPVMLLAPDARRAALREPAVRERMRAGAASVGPRDPFLAAARYGSYVFAETFSQENAPLLGRSVDNVAIERGADHLDVLLDAVLADDLRTGLDLASVGDDDEAWSLRAAAVKDPRTITGGSDAGAHLDIMCHANYPTVVLGEAVRERGLLTLEEAVRLMTDVPARLYGLRERGRVEEGWQADLVVFDPDRIASDPAATRWDLPGGGYRLYAEAVGVAQVLVGGVAVVVEGALTGDAPGTVLRSGVDTETVTVPGG